MTYSEATIFSDQKINDLCDFIFAKLVERFPPAPEDEHNDYVYKHFVLSGKAANILQGVSGTTINNITFETDDQNIYYFCQNDLPKLLFKAQAILYKERTLLYPLNYFFEIWKTDTIDAIEIDGIQLQNKNIIPAETL